MPPLYTYIVAYKYDKNICRREHDSTAKFKKRLATLVEYQLSMITNILLFLCCTTSRKNTTNEAAAATTQVSKHVS